MINFTHWKQPLLTLAVTASAYYFFHSNCLTKIFPIFLLILYTYSNPIHSKYNVDIRRGLIFSLIGDYLLEIDEENKSYFIFGLLSFLIAHVFYSFGFVANLNFQHIFVVFQFCAMYYFGIMKFLLPAVEDDLFFPLALYGIVISIMVHCAICRLSSCSEISAESRTFAGLGAILFAISDSILAIDRFYVPVKNAKSFIMFTYYLAQILISVSTY
jgi:uncharacterized membrane protein YhhN